MRTLLLLCMVCAASAYRRVQLPYLPQSDAPSWASTRATDPEIWVALLSCHEFALNGLFVSADTEYQLRNITLHTRDVRGDLPYADGCVRLPVSAHRIEICPVFFGTNVALVTDALQHDDATFGGLWSQHARSRDALIEVDLHRVWHAYDHASRNNQFPVGSFNVHYALTEI